VEKSAGTCELDKLGGLAGKMPVTYISALIASLSISGIPPLNGFFSKWMIYQGVVESFPNFKAVGAVCLLTAMFGSGLTLASFMKLLHAAYLGQPAQRFSSSEPREAPFTMCLPVVTLSALCVILGIFAYQLPLKYFILPSLGVTQITMQYSNLAVALILTGLALGLAVYYLNLTRKAVRRDDLFSGGEDYSEKHKVSGVDFYNTIRDFTLIRRGYGLAESGKFDIYEQLKRPLFYFGRLLGRLHNGILPSYLVWCFLGMAILFIWLAR
jgi:NADH:ubiquinone oxidoreductase subunit 5 (subunit L)/multisubunit Na+/H+ antiporter MnhA subunit